MRTTAAAPASHPRWRRLVGPGVAVIVVAAIAIRAPHLLTGTARSPQAAALVVLAVAVLIGVGRLRRLPAAARHGIRLAAVVGVGALVLVPALRTTSIDEPLPALATVAAPAQDPAVSPATTSAPVAAPDQAAAAAPAPTQARQGGLRGLTGHRAEGTASLLTTTDGARLIRFERFEVSAGPDYDVWVVPGPNATDPKGGVRVADLKATRGNQHYEVPTGFDTTGTFSVLIWCEAFDVEVATATIP